MAFRVTGNIADLLGKMLLIEACSIGISYHMLLT